MRVANVQIDFLDYVFPCDNLDAIETGVEVDNLVGEGAEDLANQWTRKMEKGSSIESLTREERTVAQMTMFLGARGRTSLLEHVGRSKGPGLYDSDSDGEEEADARGKAAEYFFAPSSIRDSPTRSHQTLTPSPPKQFVGILQTPFATPPRETNPPLQNNAQKHFVPSSSSSPVYSRLSRVSIASPSVRHSRTSVASSKSARSSLLFPIASPLHPNFGAKKRKTLTVFPSSPDLFENTHQLGPPRLLVVSTPMHNSKLFYGSSPRFDFASPSLSPPPSHYQYTSQVQRQTASRSSHSPAAVLKTPQIDCPPMLDLEKILKQKSSDKVLRRKKKQKVSSGRSSSISSPSSHGLLKEYLAAEGSENHEPKNPSVEDRLPSALGLPPASVVSGGPTLQSAPQDVGEQLSPGLLESERQRRARAKRRQQEIRAKLVRALPPERVPSSIKAKVERSERRRLALHATVRADFMLKRQAYIRNAVDLSVIVESSQEDEAVIARA